MLSFIREKFEFLVVTAVLLVLIQAWVASDYRPDLKEFVIIVSGAWLALLRVVQKPGAPPLSDSVNTGSGDVIIQPTPKQPEGDV